LNPAVSETSCGISSDLDKLVPFKQFTVYDGGAPRFEEDREKYFSVISIKRTSPFPWLRKRKIHYIAFEPFSFSDNYP
jgi:hypothetical protein